MSFLKQCTKCSEVKLWYEFSKDKSKTHGLKSQCKDCQKQYDKKWRKNNKEAISLNASLGYPGINVARENLEIVNSGKAFETLKKLQG
jgi:hypothetical protein